MTVPRIAPILVLLAGLASPALAEAPVTVGGDSFVSGSTITDGSSAEGDLLAMGGSVTITGTVAEDVHAMGFDVEVDGPIAGDVVAAGASVSLDNAVGGDVTAAAMTLRTGPNAQVSGNARLAAGTVTVEGPVRGALVAAGGEVVLNAPVSGDARLTAGSITFGDNARVDGILTYSGPNRIDIPPSVAPADRVRYIPATQPEMWRDIREDWRDWDGPVDLSPMAVVGGFLINLGLFLLIGAICLTLAPRLVRRLRRTADARPGMVMLTGAIGLSILFGAIPVSVLTIVGLPLAPLILLLIVVTWVLGYILGAYVLAMRVLRGLGSEESPGIAMRLLALAIGVTLAALLNFIPIIGWMVNFALVLLGVGAITAVLFDRMMTGVRPESDASLEPINQSNT